MFQIIFTFIITFFLLLAPSAEGGKRDCAAVVIGPVAVGLKFKPDTWVQLPDGFRYRVLKKLNAGEDRRVFHVQRAADGRQFAFKLARSKAIPKGKLGMDKERTTVARLSEIEVPHPPIEAYGEDWLLRDWVDGKLGTHWYAEWKAAGYPEEDPYWQKFLALVKRTADRGLVVGAMDLDDIIIRDDEWVVIDSGRVREMTPAAAWEYYVDDLAYSWGSKIGDPVLERLVEQRLRAAQAAEH